MCSLLNMIRTHPKTKKWPLKNDGWKLEDCFPFVISSLFRGLLGDIRSFSGDYIFPLLSLVFCSKDTCFVFVPYS